MRRQVIFAKFIGLGAILLLGAFMQDSESQFDPDKPLIVESPPQTNPPPENLPQDGGPIGDIVDQENNYNPSPDVPLEEMQLPPDTEQMPNLALTKKRELQDVGMSEYTETWSETTEANQAIINQTQHRRREIDPAKLANLTALSRTFGSLHALRVSCIGQEDQTFRSKMATMLEMEAPSTNYIRDPLIIAFNNGFQSGGKGEAECPKNREIIEARLAAVGRNISLAMVEFYTPKPIPAPNSNLSEVENKAK